MLRKIGIVLIFLSPNIHADPLLNREACGRAMALMAVEFSFNKEARSKLLMRTAKVPDGNIPVIDRLFSNPEDFEVASVSGNQAKVALGKLAGIADLEHAKLVSELAKMTERGAASVGRFFEATTKLFSVATYAGVAATVFISSDYATWSLAAGAVALGSYPMARLARGVEADNKRDTELADNVPSLFTYARELHTETLGPNPSPIVREFHQRSFGFRDRVRWNVILDFENGEPVVYFLREE